LKLTKRLLDRTCRINKIILELVQPMFKGKVHCHAFSLNVRAGPPDSDQEVNRAIAVGTPAPTFCSLRIERPNYFLRWAATSPSVGARQKLTVPTGMRCLEPETSLRSVTARGWLRSPHTHKDRSPHSQDKNILPDNCQKSLDVFRSGSRKPRV
jgi:hypothetical protein